MSAFGEFFGRNAQWGGQWIGEQRCLVQAENGLDCRRSDVSKATGSAEQAAGQRTEYEGRIHAAFSAGGYGLLDCSDRRLAGEGQSDEPGKRNAPAAPCLPFAGILFDKQPTDQQ